MRKRTTVQLTCSTCNTEFLRAKHQVRKDNVNHYCSRECERIARIVRMKKVALTKYLFIEDSSSTILTADNVRKIRQDYASGTTVRSICSYTGMSETAIRYLIKNKTWKHVV